MEQARSKVSEAMASRVTTEIRGAGTITFRAVAL